MGGSSSKVVPEPSAPTIDLAQVATVPLQLAQDFGKQAQDLATKAEAAAAELQRQNSWLSNVLTYGGLAIVLGIISFVLYYFAWPALKNTFSSSASSAPSAPAPPASSAPVSPSKVGSSKPPVPLKSIWSPAGLKDAEITQIIPSAELPQNGSYGYQYWMYVKDWNYKFGQEKSVFKRTDPSNTVANPMVTLHPSDNILKITVSVYSGEQTSKTEPAPAGHSGATDDVFICEVPNLDIQKWVAVSVSIDTKNLDVYFNGKLVKSCLLTGLPKPALGDIIVSDEGGFSGYLCSFNSYSRALTPTDAQAFTLGGAPCSIPEETGQSYTTQFGIFNSSGKEVTKYVF